MKTIKIIFLRVFFFSLAPFLTISNVSAQEEQNPIKIFGYFQNSFQQWTGFKGRPKQNSFSLQQLNLFLQKDFSPNWTAFMNFEFVNNFSSGRQWGSANLEEAWIKYRSDMTFNLKLGLSIPIFNNLNEIKNRTPLLAYIVRPLAYETSFSEFISIEVLTPLQAFVQVYGFFPAGDAKFDYAVYVGNSPNINNNSQRGQTGVDTTEALLFGGRFGFRYQELKLGLSATYDKDNIIETLAQEIDIPRKELNEIPKTRLGGDLSYNLGNIYFESEFILVDMEKNIVGLDADLDFYYATLGYHFSENLFIYSSYWVMDEHLLILTSNQQLKDDEDLRVYNIGASYAILDRVSLKAQYSRVIKKNENFSNTLQRLLYNRDEFNVYALAVSVYF